jgi:hypothetical protein
MIAVPYEIFRRDLLDTPVWMEAEQDTKSKDLTGTRVLHAQQAFTSKVNTIKLERTERLML